MYSSLKTEKEIKLTGKEKMNGMTVDQFLELSEEEQIKIWDKWFKEAEEKVKDMVLEVRPDAKVPSR